ncbi:MAG TPA: hypothetical protein ENJ97_01125 [Planctomycetes bacterium]|nr:hypothetical protein [Planctomycetota bacterium]
MNGRPLESFAKSGAWTSLLFALLLLPWSGCRGPEYAAHQPVTGVDRPYNPSSGEGKSVILQGREEARRGAEEEEKK